MFKLMTCISVHSFPSGDTTFVILATGFGKGQSDAASGTASLKQGADWQTQTTVATRIVQFAHQSSGRSFLDVPEFNFVDFKQNNQDGEKERPQHQAQKPKDAEPSNDTDKNPKSVNLHSTLD